MATEPVPVLGTARWVSAPRLPCAPLPAALPAPPPALPAWAQTATLNINIAASTNEVFFIRVSWRSSFYEDWDAGSAAVDCRKAWMGRVALGLTGRDA